jgi:hypothetical protein
VGEAIEQWQNASSADLEIAAFRVGLAERQADKAAKVAGFKGCYVGRYMIFCSNGAGRDHICKVVKIGKRGGVYVVRYYRTRGISQPKLLKN